MAKVIKKIKLQLPAGKATPAPPVGTVLGPAGVNIGEFVTKFNEQTRAQMGDIIPVEMSVYDDRSFTFVLKVSPAASLVMKAQLKEIAEKKMPDLNTTDPAAAERLIAGTARSMGVDVK